MRSLTYCRWLLVTLFSLSLSVSAKDLNADLYGTWKIKAMIGGGAVGSLSEHEVQSLIGRTLNIAPGRFVFNGKPCAETRYERTREETNAYFEREWNTEVSDLALPNPVTIVETGCNVLYPMRGGRLMVAEGGVFFEAVRVPGQNKRREK
jgi:hypothetical protein